VPRRLAVVTGLAVASRQVRVERGFTARLASAAGGPPGGMGGDFGFDVGQGVAGVLG